MQKVTIETIKNESIIDLQVSGSFYRSIQHVLQHLTEGREDEIVDLISKINEQVSDEELNDWELATQTMMILSAEIEVRAREQKKVEMVDMDVPTESDSPAEDQSAS